MAGNPLLGSQPQPEEAPKNPEGQRVITLVSNCPADQINGLDIFLKSFNSPEVRAEVNPFRHTIQRKARRSMGGKFSSGLSQEVTESIDLNPNEDLFGLRRWLGGIRQNPASVLLLNVNKVKDTPLAAPLIFSDLMKGKRPVLVTGADRSVQDQLFAKIVPDFSQVPTQIQGNPILKSSLLARVQRRKGFQGGVRLLADLEFLPPQVQEMIARINSGGDPTKLSEPEIVNICLLGDMVSRYLNLLQGFKETLDAGSLNMQQMSGMFEQLISDVPLEQAFKSFQEFFEGDEEKPEKVGSKGELFSHINRFINATGGGSRGATRSQKLDQAFKRVMNVVIEQRIRVDPVLWRRCNFIYENEAQEQKLMDDLGPILGLFKKIAEEGPEAITQDFREKMGAAVFELVSLSNMTLDQVKKDPGGLAKQKGARYLLPLFQMEKFQAAHLIDVKENNRATLLNKDKFLGLFKNVPITIDDLKNIWERLDREINRAQRTNEAVRGSTLDVMIGHDKDREKALKEIYIVNAAQELVHFTFHLGEKNIAPIDRLCGISVLQSRFGLEVSAKPIQPNSIGLFEFDDSPPLGKLDTEASILSRAYTALIGLRVERLVRKMVDHKIGYLQNTFGDNFFEVIYRNVVTGNDLPLSRTQLAWFITEKKLMGSLEDKGFKSERENDLLDSFLTLDQPSLSSLQKPERDFREFDNFEEKFKTANQKFKQMLGDLKSHGEQDPATDVKALIWSLYKRGIYNLERQEAKDIFRKSEFYGTLKDLIAKISSENYSIFTKDLQEEGVKIFMIPKFHGLLTIGARFGYLIESKVVRYQLIGSPAEVMEELDPLSRVFNEKINHLFTHQEENPDFQRLFQAAGQLQKSTDIWREHSRHLAFVLLDRFLTETVIKQLKPGKIQPQHLWYVNDQLKLCLGPSLTSQSSVPFAKILQVPENMGNIQKNPRSSSTTIDDFTIEVLKISRLRAELENLESISEDVLEIVQNLTHERAESQLVLKYEQGLQLLNKLLSKPLRHLGENDVKSFHKVASALRDTLQAFFNTPGSGKDQLVMRVQAHLQSRRSDGHSIKLNFTDQFILDMTQIKVMQKQGTGSDAVTRQRKVEVEVDSKYQTLATRIREVVRTHDIIAKKQFILFSPEGQRKKQIDYVLDIIETMQVLRGNGLTFFVDSTMMTDDQMKRLATRIKPQNFFMMDKINPEAPEGVKITSEKDPLTGRLIKKPAPSTGATAS